MRGARQISPCHPGRSAAKTRDPERREKAKTYRAFGPLTLGPGSALGQRPRLAGMTISIQSSSLLGFNHEG